MQDIDAHTPYTESVLGAKFHRSPELFNSGENLADNKKIQPARWEHTKLETEKALQKYRDEVNKD